MTDTSWSHSIVLSKPGTNCVTHQIRGDEGIGGMGIGELLQVMGAFELQHQRLLRRFLRAIKNPPKRVLRGVYKESLE